ncbi:bifunctional UDP-sugar hydrolase/5'-nucleotidase [Eggerthella lenta]|uniref:Bifunctional metallophosphatase/5'-nucleotidase n=1 Tax=Eggerthella lenta TaxID=84112 RepID=A0A369M9Z9_EGGLN|nr:bifunctional UDP-sugar hydrolase/5'-nucleotidase [Eggerthella lenta]MDB1806722.1 bifunctional UDP-sugar hydrolase/5'-nucleotidase [Eggerthella lenta]RDB68558.1 bifunctional metallophosphatase/5'-nucleotidase [Eggerthella lenta]
MTHLPAPHRITRRSFCTLSAVALASLALPARRAFGDEAATAATATQPGAIVIVHTNDVHCAVDDNLGYAKLVNYAKTMRSTYGADNVTLVDAGDAVQGKAMGTLTNGEYLIDVMNECGYDFAIPGNHEFDYGMTQFNTLVARANAKYLSCNFTDLRTGNLMFDAYAMREYDTAVGKRKVAYLGICTPESLTKSSPAHFQEDGIYRYGFCEDDSGTKLYDAVQSAVDQARADGADYVVALAHLGQDGVTPRWTSTSVAANTSGIDVVIDGHSHELYAQTPLNKNGEPVLVTQTGTQLVGIGQVVIDPANGTIAAYASNDTETVTASTAKGTASIVKAWDGIDADTAAFIAGLQADLAKITERVIGRSDVRLVALEDDDYTWAVRAHETNLGDFVADAYLALAWHGGVMADIGFVNGGGIRANIEPGDVTYGDLINVQPYNNQLCYVDTLGQNILDALEAGVANLPNPSGGLQHVSGLAYTVRTDIPSSVQMPGGKFGGVTGEYRVRDVLVNGEPLDVNRRYKLVSHTFLLVEGGDGLTMFMNDEAVLLDLDNKALIEYIQYDLKGTIGGEYADPDGQGRIVIKNGPDPEPEPLPTPEPADEPAPGSGGKPLASTGDPLGTAVVGAAAVAAAAGAVAVSAGAGTRR